MQGSGHRFESGIAPINKPRKMEVLRGFACSAGFAVLGFGGKMLQAFEKVIFHIFLNYGCLHKNNFVCILIKLF